MQIFIRFVAFAFGLVLGVAPYILSYAPTPYGRVESKTAIVGLKHSIQPQHLLTGELRIANLGWHIENGQPVYRFLIENGQDKTVSYSGYHAERPFPRVDLNGKSITPSHCGTGARDFIIQQGESVVVEVPGYYFDEPSSANARFTVEFYLKTEGSTEYEPLTSEPFKLDKEFRQALK